MGCLMCIAFWVVVVVAAVKIYKFFKKSMKIPPTPKLPETWWGPRDKASEDTSIKPFKIDVSDEVLADLQKRLEKARPFVPPLEGIQHQYGLNTNLLNTIIDFWKNKYDWREREKFLNQYPQFTVSIQGLRVHYIHVKPENPGKLKVKPLLLLHGWPGSVREFYEILPLLTTPQPGRDFVFEVIVPSLPGYGFSEAAVRPGFGSAQMGLVLKNLMSRLGHEKFYIQGGDWGAIIISQMAVLFPENLLGLHTNLAMVRNAKTMLKLLVGCFFPSLIVPKEYQDKVYPLSKRFSYMLLETGYMHIQATKPDTVGVALNDSPVGLAAYILEKFITWTNPDYRSREDGGLNEKYTYTNLLDNVMIYWVTQSITTSMRLYSEGFTSELRKMNLEKIPITVPAAIARFVHDIDYTPTTNLKEKYKNIVQVTDHEGGHFAAFELPQVLAKDIYDGFEQM